MPGGIWPAGRSGTTQRSSMVPLAVRVMVVSPPWSARLGMLPSSLAMRGAAAKATTPSLLPSLWWLVPSLICLIS